MRLAGFTLADGGERRADRGRVVSVVVIDHDPGRLTLPFEATADAGECPEPGRDVRRGEPEGGRGPGDGEGVRGVAGAGPVGNRTERPPASSSSPYSSTVVPYRGRDPAQDSRRRPGGGRVPVADAPQVPSALRRPVHDGIGDDPEPGVPETVDDRFCARIPDVRDERPAGPAGFGRSTANASTTSVSSMKTSG